MEKLYTSLKDRSFNLSQEHYEKLSDTFTEKEVDDFNFMETAIAISKYANGKDDDFCSKIIRMISNINILNYIHPFNCISFTFFFTVSTSNTRPFVLHILGSFGLYPAH